MNKKVLIVIAIFTLFFSIPLDGVGLAQVIEQNGDEIEQKWWWKKKKKEDTEEYRNLEGGPENPERTRQQPVSNIVLQQMYPETVVLQGPATANRIALTFDDGPDPRFTEQVLDVLAEYNVPATFFVMGSRAVAFPDIVRRMNEEGHIIGNHTYVHPNLVEVGDVDELEREVRRTSDAIEEIVDYRPRLFRAPYGFLYQELVERLAEMTYSVVVWSVDSLDWQEAPPETIANLVINNTHPGAIILMHDGADWNEDRTNTIQSLRQIIPTLQEQGYEFVTVPELVNIPYQR